MPDRKLQELIDTLKQQGVESGEESARQIVEAAKQQAGQILAQAQKEAQEVLDKARGEADKQMKQLQSSLEIAASQFVTELKRLIEKNLLTIPLQEKLKGDLGDPDFLKKLMAGFVQAYAADPQQRDIRLLLPAGASDDLWKFATQLLAKHYGGGQAGEDLAIKMDAQGLSFGFMVNRADGNVRLDFSDEAFLNLFLGYLSGRFRELFKTIDLGQTARR